VRARDDEVQMVTAYLARFARKFGKHVDCVSPETMDCLVSYARPGSIREVARFPTLPSRSRR
jgi:transcriptional regulator with PAS, ATPase and Fis domain